MGELLSLDWLCSSVGWWQCRHLPSAAQTWEYSQNSGKSQFFSGKPVIRVVCLEKMPEMADGSQQSLGLMWSWCKKGYGGSGGVCFQKSLMFKYWLHLILKKYLLFIGARFIQAYTRYPKNQAECYSRCVLHSHFTVRPPYPLWIFITFPWLYRPDNSSPFPPTVLCPFPLTPPHCLCKSFIHRSTGQIVPTNHSLTGISSPFLPDFQWDNIEVFYRNFGFHCLTCSCCTLITQYSRKFKSGGRASS